MYFYTELRLYMQVCRYVCCFVVCVFFLGTEAQTQSWQQKEAQTAQYWTDSAKRALHYQRLRTQAKPEQDCQNGIPVCQQTYTQRISYQGFGQRQEVPTSSCLKVRERNSVWYVINVQTSGTLAFQIEPVDREDDYDFAVYDITNRTCADIPTRRAPEVRCNFSVTPGRTGLSSAGSSASESASGNNQSTPLPVTAGQVYVLVIDNFSETQNGYTIDFGYGTASLFDTIAPLLKAVRQPCLSRTMFVQCNEPVRCSSIARDGSDFVIQGPGGTNVRVISAEGEDCGNYTARIKLTLSEPLQLSGNYTLRVVRGTDGNRLLDNCNLEMPENSLDFVNELPTVKLIVSPLEVCEGQEVTANALIENGGPWDWPLIWNNNQSLGAGPNVFRPTTSGVIRVMIDNPDGCMPSADSTFVTVYPLPELTFSSIPTLPAEFLAAEKPYLSVSVFPDSTVVKTVIDFGGDTVAEATTATHQFRNPGDYVVSVTTTNAQGCVRRAEIGVLRILRGRAFMPTAFTPNQDGQNDGLVPQITGYDKYQLQIFDRWGNLIFDNEFRPNKYWNGAYFRDIYGESVYSYRLRLFYLGEEEKPLDGTITLIR